ncbi:MAG: PorV/PorQ family protein [Melioribacteraceae bacterium]|nr:PorV/PorQ family protein [Melioribacteraceae bacterium]MCF8353660.1 PorV/PorQ family protein [Melioribacteraceae bacterium]MCF8393430.1 PorV/PorQ family protein [Melioribacteraceae bacterium]MCF8419287.1 PorV/PorQ family protein [Melioribacteraceae bacterium]
MKTLLVVITLILLQVSLFAQKPYRVGTTAASFLEVGYGSAGNAMGDAYVSMVNDLSSAYWNPAGLASMEKHEAMFAYQPWLADINTSFAAVGIVLPSIGTIAASLVSMDYGEMDVTTMRMQEGTGEKFTANDIAVGLSFARKLATWFSFGATAKYISQTIWHTSASSMAVDLGVKINTNFFSPTGNNEDGLAIGMSISNYGIPLQFDGIDLSYPIDISPDEAGNYKNTSGQFKMQSWDLPLIYRIGFSVTPVYLTNHKFTISVDALHPNNNSEHVNLGAQYILTFASFGSFYIRGGYKALFMDRSDYGLALGFGVDIHALYNEGIKLNYSFREHKVLGNTHSYEVAVRF